MSAAIPGLDAPKLESRPVQPSGRRRVSAGTVLSYVTLMIPGAVTFVPLFVIVAGLGWVNSLQGLIVPGLFNTFAAFMFRQFYLNFPRDLEEAGRVDGLGYGG